MLFNWACRHRLGFTVSGFSLPSTMNAYLLMSHTAPNGVSIRPGRVLRDQAATGTLEVGGVEGEVAGALARRVCSEASLGSVAMRRVSRIAEVRPDLGECEPAFSSGPSPLCVAPGHLDNPRVEDDRFRLIAEYNRDVLLLGRPGQLEWVSPAAADVLGWVPGEVVGRPFIDLVHPDDHAEVIAARDALEAGGVAQARCRMRHGDGSWHWWESRARGVPDDDGVFRGLSVSSWRLVDDDMAVLRDLQMRDRWLDLIAENSSDVVVLLRETGEVDWISRPVGIRESITSEMVVGTAPWGMVHPDDRVAAMEALARVAEHGTTSEIEIRFEEAPGHYRWLAAKGHRLDDPLLPGRMVVSFRDIEDEHRAREQLRSSERRYRTLAENATDVVYTIGMDGVITWVSQSVREIFGWRPGQLIGHPVREFMHPDDLDDHSPRHEQVLRDGGDGGQAEIRFLAADGEWRWVGLTGRVLRDQDGEALGGIESLRDISAEMAARHALEESERRFRLAMEGSPEGMAVIGLDRRFISVNPALCTALGRDAAWFEHRCIDEIVCEADLEADHAVRTRLLAGEVETQAQERRLVAADGSLRWVLHAVGLLRDHDGGPLFFVSHFQNITDRKSAEADLEYAATHDPLTGLSNRANLVDEIRRALEREPSVAAADRGGPARPGPLQVRQRLAGPRHG